MRDSFPCWDSGWWSVPSAGWRFRRLAWDYERLSTALAGLHYVAFSMLHKAAPIFDASTAQQYICVSLMQFDFILNYYTI